MTLDADDFNARVEARWLQMQLRCLAANLGIGGALCESWRSGADWGRWYEDPYQNLADRPWSPGCGRPSPGCNLSTRGK